MNVNTIVINGRRVFMREDWQVIFHFQRMELLTWSVAAPKTDDDKWCTQTHTRTITNCNHPREHKQRTMVVTNNNTSSMSGWKHHLLDDHRDMVDYRQIPASVASVPASVPAPVRARQGSRRWIPQTNPFPREPPPEDKLNSGIPREGRQASAVTDEESMSVFFQANTGGRPIHRPIPRMPEGLGIEINSNKA